MTTSADDGHEAPPVSTGRDFGGPLTEIIVRHLREHTPEGTLEAVLRAAGEIRSAETLSDSNTWSSYRQYRRLLEATAGVLGGAVGLATAGSRIFESIGGVETVETLRSLGSPTPVGRWVLVEACRQSRLWRDLGHPATNMSVNASACQIDARCLIDDVRFALGQSGLPPGSLAIEMTETCLMRDTKDALNQLKALKALGVRLAIDDFGTGYSSLSYLQQFPVDSIKIDRSFISAMSDSPEAGAIIRTLIQLGKVLNIETVAEGIESTEQLTRLQSEDCDAGQGYLVARPLAPGQVERFFKRSGVAPSHLDATPELVLGALP